MICRNGCLLGLVLRDLELRPAIALCSIVLALLGCGGATGAPPPQAVTITVQPVSQIVPIGQTATFTVTATGSAPISYQWSENGSAIPGAISASYTTPAVALGAGGSPAIGSFQVTVSNAGGSVGSNTATLTAGPRSPKAGDVRYLSFQQVSSPGFMKQVGVGVLTLVSAEQTASSALGIPLLLGNAVAPSCGWDLNFYPLPPPTNNYSMYYQVTFLQGTTIAPFLQSLAGPGNVINSLDIEPTCNGLTPGAVAVSMIGSAQTTQGTFDQKLEVVSPSQVQATVAADGHASRIVTAAAFDASGNVNLVSYGWTGDTTTVYEAQTYVVTSSQVESTAISMANQGYFISAFGGNDTDGWIMIGERVQGDTLARPITYNGAANSATPDSAYFTCIFFVQDSGIGAPASSWEQ